MRRKIRNILGFAVAAALVVTAAILTISHAGSINGVQWNQIGPAPEQIDGDQSVQGNGPDSGQIVDIAIDFRDTSDKVIYVATEDGGIWQSTDGGTTWRTTTDFLNSLSMGAVALDPANPSIVYAGTGDPANNSSFKGEGQFKGIGIYKSTDEGGTWTLTPISAGFNNVAIRRMVMPNPNVLLIATGGSLSRSPDGGATFTNQTINGGTSATIDDLHLDTAATPTSGSGQTVYAAVDRTGIFRSTDSGATWGANLFTKTNGSPLATPNFSPGFISFSQSTAPDNKTIYASVQNALPVCSVAQPPPCASAPFWGLFVSTDSGATWTQPAAGGNPSNNCTQCGYGQTIGVDPRDATVVYLGFVDMWKSTDSGASFTKMTGVHNDHHALVFSPHVPAMGSTPFYDGSDGGIARSDGTNFTALNGPNPGPGKALATSLLRDIDIGRGNSTVPANNAYTYGGMQDTGTAGFRAGDSPTTWHMGPKAGDGAGVSVDVCAPKHVIGVVNGCPKVTTDGGATWTQLQNSGGLIDSAMGPTETQGTPAFAFGKTVAVDPSPSCHNVVYASINTSNTKPLASCVPSGAVQTFEIWRSTDGGNNYAKMHTFGAGQQVDVIGTVAIDPDRLWVGLDDGTLAVTANAFSGGASATWTAVTIPGAPSPVTDLAIDPTDTSTVVVTYPGMQVGKHVFRTTNGGANWTDISAGLPNLPVHTVVIDPSTNPHTIIIGNDAGVLQSADNGATWQVLGLGMPTVDVVSLALDSTTTPEVLRAGTFGRSVFEFGAATGPLLQINSTFNFGTVCLGQNTLATENLTIFNVGSQPLTVNSITQLSGSPEFTLSGPALPATIQPGEQLNFTVTFQPKAADAGNVLSAVFQINSNDTFQPTRQLTYTATVGAPKIGVAIANGGSFGNVCPGASSTTSLTITNSGSCPLVISSVTSSSPDFVVGALNVPVTVAPGNSLAVPITFLPTTHGMKSGTITIKSNAPDVMVSVAGNVPTGEINVSGATGNFGNVCAANMVSQTFTVANVAPSTNGCDLNVTGASINCPDFTIQGNPFTSSTPISTDFSVPLTVKFTPTSGGTKNCKLTITSDDPDMTTVTVTLTGTTPTPNIDVPPDTAPFGYNFPATVIQSVGACSSKNPFPVSNNGSCPTNITAVMIGPPNPVLPGSTPADYSLAGLPSLPTPLQPGHILGEGDLSTVFKPTLITRAESAAVKVTWESDPITHTTTSVSRNLCGEGTSRGARVLVTAAGVPLASVDKIELHRLESNRKSISIDNVNDAPLQTVTQTAPCASFQFQREWGGVTNPIQLTAGDYQITVDATVDNKRVSQTVSFTLGTCSFNQNIVVAF